MTRTTVWRQPQGRVRLRGGPRVRASGRAARRRPGRYCGPAADSERRHLQKIRLLPWLPLYEGQQTGGYSALRTWGNYGFNWLFSLVARKKITDLGSGLNLYAVEPLKSEYYKKFPDTLYFNDCMILALCQMKQRVLFFPISWREEDQVSNNKLTSFGISLLKLCGKYLAGPRAFVEREWREKIIEDYSYEVVASNL